MRKYIISLVIMFLFLPSLVMAKGEQPVYINYKVKIIDKNGIVLKTNDSKEINIPYDTVLEIMNEYELNGKLYGSVEYNNTPGTIELSNTHVSPQEVDIEKYKSEFDKSIYIFGEDVYLYNGPSKLYGLVEKEVKIPFNTKLTYAYGDEAWAYVTYNGVKGWIYIYPYDDIIYEKGALIASVYDNKKLYTLKEINLINSPMDNNKINVSIPEYKEISYKYSYSKDPYTTYYYVIYNDVEGWYKYEPLQVANIYTDDFIVNAEEDLDVLEKPLIDSKVLGKINKNEEYNILAIAIKDSIEDNTYESWSYIKYKDITGWLHYLEKGKDNVENIMDNKDNKNNTDTKSIKKNNDSIKIILFSVSMIIILVFIIFTLLNFNKSKSDKSN